MGFWEKLTELHKPVIERIDQQTASGRENLKAIQKVIKNVSFLPLKYSRIPAIEEDLGLKSVSSGRSDKRLNEPFLREQGLESPTGLLGKTDELNTIIKKANGMNRKLGGP